MKLFGFTETRRFTKKIMDLMSDEEYSRLQIYLCQNPEIGSIIKGSGGIRKMRWSASGRGKRGGARVIYYFAVSREKILFLDVYTKNEQMDLKPEQIRELRLAVEEYEDEK